MYWHWRGLWHTYHQNRRLYVRDSIIPWNSGKQRVFRASFCSWAGQSVRYIQNCTDVHVTVRRAGEPSPERADVGCGSRGTSVSSSSARPPRPSAALTVYGNVSNQSRNRVSVTIWIDAPMCTTNFSLSSPIPHLAADQPMRPEVLQNAAILVTGRELSSILWILV